MAVYRNAIVSFGIISLVFHIDCNLQGNKQDYIKQTSIVAISQYAH